MIPCCNNPSIYQDSTSCAEIAGDCYQWCWLQCSNCGRETESLEAINGDPSVWEALKNLELTHRVD